MAVKIVRQANKIALLGAPTSSAALSEGHERAPAALRNAGLIERLESVGYEVSDLGDDRTQVYKQDEQSPRARNLPAVITALEALKPRVEQAVKSSALPLIIGGDCSIALATVAGTRRYFRHVSMIYMDRDADLNTPATTASGCVDGMVVSHLTGRGAAELVRFWGEPPLVREPDLALFGIDRMEPSEEEALRKSPLRSFNADEIKHKGAAAVARVALDRIHAQNSEFVLHLDVDVIAGFAATNCPGSGGLTLDDVREALDVFVGQKNLAVVEVTAYNPTKDPDGAAAATIIDLLAGSLEKRLQSLKSAPLEISAAARASTSAAPTQLDVAPKPEGSLSPEPLPEAQPGESWSSGSLEEPAPEQNQPEQTEAPAHAEAPASRVEFPAEPPQPSEPSSVPSDEPSERDDSGEPGD